MPQSLSLLTTRKPVVALATLVTVALVGLAIAWPIFQPAEPFMPHGHCYLWLPRLLWTHVVSDLLIGLSYVAISSTLAYMVFKVRRELPFHWMVVAFGVFIIACGSTHFVEAWTVWYPEYWFAAFVKVITAIASVGTAFLLPPLVPRVIALLEAERLSRERKRELEFEIEHRLAAEADLQKMHATLEQRVRDRTSALSQANSALTLYQTMFESATWGVAIVDLVRNLVQLANPAFARMHGYDVNEVTGLPIAKLHAPESRSQVPEVDDIVNARGRLMFESLHQRKDRSFFNCLTDSTLVRDPEGLPLFRLSYYQDISGQKRAEEDIRNVVMHARCILWRAVVQGREDWRNYEPGTFKFDSDLQVQDEIGAQHFQALEIPPGSTYSQAWVQSRDPGDMKLAEEIAYKAFLNGSSTYSYECRAHDKFGQMLWLRQDVAIVPLGPGRWQCTGVCTDVTEQRRISDQLHQQAELLELSHDAIIVRRLTGEILYWNRGAEALYGWPRKEALGKSIGELLRTTSLPRANLLVTLQQKGYWAGELRHTARDGRVVIVNSRHLLLHRGDGSTVVLETNHNITSQHHPELALV